MRTVEATNVTIAESTASTFLQFHGSSSSRGGVLHRIMISGDNDHRKRRGLGDVDHGRGDEDHHGKEDEGEESRRVPGENACHIVCCACMRESERVCV